MITRTLRSDRWRQDVQSKRKLEEATQLALKMVAEPRAKERGQTLDIGKGKETDSFPKPPRE